MEPTNKKFEFLRSLFDNLYHAEDDLNKHMEIKDFENDAGIARHQKTALMMQNIVNDWKETIILYLKSH